MWLFSVVAKAKDLKTYILKKVRRSRLIIEQINEQVIIFSTLLERRKNADSLAEAVEVEVEVEVRDFTRYPAWLSDDYE